MDSKLYSKIILLQLETTGTTNMIIKGSSMTPTLKNDDIITITKSEEYKSGDILVYLYKGNNILAHRLLFKKNDRLKNSLGTYYDMFIPSSNLYLSPTSICKVANIA